MRCSKQVLENADRVLGCGGETTSLETEKQTAYQHLVEKWRKKGPLTVKLGVDPTKPDLTFGHWAILNRLKLFQNEGHNCVLIIGDYTATVGDPSGQNHQRPILTQTEVKKNAESYLAQAFKILDKDKTQTRYNSEWFQSMHFGDALKLARTSSVAQLLARRDFSKRHEESKDISLVEFLYPLMQAYDSVILKADVELGGSDQLFNLLMGRQIQKAYGQEEQIIATFPLLVGLDGKKKMSKSLNNYIALNDNPTEMFGKIMSIDDATTEVYARLLLLKNQTHLATLKTLHQMEAKKQIATEIVAHFYGEETGQKQRQNFETVFSKKLPPQHLETIAFQTLAQTNGKIDIPTALVQLGFCEGKKAAKRLLQQTAVKLNGKSLPPLPPPLEASPTPRILQVGKRKFIKII